MDNTFIIAILSSSVAGSIITTIYNQLSARKNDSLVRITDERKYWREKIRTIAEQIGSVAYQNRQDGNINKYLVQLEVSINPYGRSARYDFEHDSHIWPEIESIKNAPDEETYNRHKELLLFYLSLMLKEDWERSKREVKGFSRTLIELAVLSVINVYLECIYLNKSVGVLNLYDIINMWIGTVVFYIAIRGFLFLFTGKIVEKNRLKIRYLFQLLVWYVFMIPVIILLSALLCLILFGDSGKLGFIAYVAYLALFVEGTFICWNWINDSLKRFVISSHVVMNRKQILDENKHDLQELRQTVNNLYTYIYEKPDASKPNVESLKSSLKEYKIQLTIRKKYLRNHFTADQNEEFTEILHELNKIKKMKGQILAYSKEGLLNRLIRYFSHITVKKWLMEQIGRICAFFWHKKGTAQLDEPEHNHTEDEIP